MALQVLRAAKAALHRHATLPIYESAQIISKAGADRAEILLSSSSHDLKRNVKRNVVTYRSISLRDDSPPVEWSYEGSEDVVLSVVHDWAQHQKIVFKSCSKKRADEKRHFVERWESSKLLTSLEVTDRHGPFYTDANFGGVSFHTSVASRIVYIAEAKKTKRDNHLKFEYTDDWGEVFNGKSTPTVVVLDFEGGLSTQAADGESKPREEQKESDKEDETQGKVIVLHPPKELCCGHPVFAHEPDKVVWVGYAILPRRFGINVCPNRISSIMTSDYNGEKARNLTEELEHSRSPRLGPDGSIYFLTNLSGGPHIHCAHLGHRSVDGKVTILDLPREVQQDGFAGIYGLRIPQIQNSKFVVTTYAESRTRVYALEIGAGMHVTAKDLCSNDKDDHTSWELLGVGKGQAVIKSHNADGEMEIRYLDLEGDHTDFKVLSHSPAPIPSLASTEIIKYPNKPTLESILLLPKAHGPLWPSSSTAKPPVLFRIHGGPHGASSTSYNPSMAALLELGVAVMYVNYTGSLGFGQAAIEALNGRAGDVDVADVKFAYDELIKSGKVDPDRVGISGGSHGGYITAYLAGAYPDAFRLAIALNPVINLVTVGAGSDIPDWAASVSGATYPLSRPPLATNESLLQAWKYSPMRLTDAVKCPVMVAVGGKDRRVPNYEGLNWVKALRANGYVDVDEDEDEDGGTSRKKLRCYMYPEDGHALDSVDAFQGSFEATAAFLAKFL